MGVPEPAAAARADADRVRRVRALALLLLLLACGLGARELWRSRAPAPPDLLVEVDGAVDHPGIHPLDPEASTRTALRAAGARVPVLDDPFLDLPLAHGYRVHLAEDGAVRVALAEERLLLGLPVDLNEAGPGLLAQLPGVGPSLAAAIVASRATQGPFPSLDALLRVRGVGPATLARLRPFLVATAPPAPAAAPPGGPLDVNRADAASLEALPGIGPVLAAAIVGDREARGPFRSTADLARVKGIGPVTVARLSSLIVALPADAEPAP